MYIADFAGNVARSSVRRILTIIHQAWFGGVEWAIHLPSPFEKVPENHIRRHRVMRRKVGGQWQYRAPTDEELSEDDAGRAW